MKVQVEVLESVVGEGGQDFQAGKTYAVKPSTATMLIQYKKARLVMANLVKLRILRDDLLQGLRRGDVIEVPASGAQRLIEEGKGELFDDGSGCEDFSGVKVLIVRDTQATVNGKKGVCVYSGKTYNLTPSEATLLIGMGKAKFPDMASAVELRFNHRVVFKGQHFRAGDTAKLPPSDALELIKLGVSEAISVEENETPLDDATTGSAAGKKGFLGKIMERL